MTGHSAVGVSQQLSLIRSMEKRPRTWQWLFGAELGNFLMRSRTCSELGEKALWVQSGLAWALIGEWTSRVLFPVPKGQWPRHGHAGALLPSYQSRTPRIVAWARAAFEQGALPSLLLMPGIAPVLQSPRTPDVPSW